jgi:hypothetical protein
MTDRRIASPFPPASFSRRSLTTVNDTGFVESAVNQVVSKRPAKKQQMRWTPSGAHQLLQVRTRVLNEQLRGDFERWHPRLQSAPEPVRLAA